MNQILRMKRPGGLAELSRAEKDALPELAAVRTRIAPCSSTSSVGRGEKMLVSKAERWRPTQQR
jgi:hypothetical protein